MKRKHLFYLLIIGIMVFVCIPTFHILKTYLNEKDDETIIPLGFTDDESNLNLTKVDTIIDIPRSKDEMVNQLKSILAYAKKKQIPISIAGAKHSMGGHTMYPNGIVINMRPYKEMVFDSVSNILTIGSGALWEDAINYLDDFDKSIAIMQAFSSFSIGGSISVNGHGWQKNAPPISSSVVSFTVMKYNGKILECSRTANPELFDLVIGGYGLFGIILDIKLKVVYNENLDFKQYKCKSAEYLSYFNKYVVDDSNAKLVFGRLNISNKNFLENATLNVFSSSKVPLSKKKSSRNNKPSEAIRLVFRNSVNSEYGKRLRWDLETNLAEYAFNDTTTRNEILNSSVDLIENKDPNSADILHEYFIPERNFYPYIEELKKILPNSYIDLLNITIRDVYADTDSYLNYARENVFGFVILFNQKKDEQSEKEMKLLTKRLVDITIKMDGTYYLPYRLHIDKKTMRIVYPQSDSFFKLKLKYDPNEIFKNKFYDHYK